MHAQRAAELTLHIYLYIDLFVGANNIMQRIVLTAYKLLQQWS